jgi:SAM-dependent methyltransferase
MQIIILWIFFIGFMPSLMAGKSYTLQETLLYYKQLNLELPKKEPDGRVQTLNKKGAASPAFEEATREFLIFSKGKKVLEIGGGYGFVAAEALKLSPQTIYHLNDIDERHLFIAGHYICSQNIPSENLKNITFKQFDITISTPQEKYDAILIARVFHFLNPEQMEKSIKFLSKSLNPHGRVYLVAITPYVKKFQKFIPEYEKRIKNDAPYPGYVLSLMDWLEEDLSCDKKQRDNLSPEPFLFLDEKVLSSLFQKNNFKILKCEKTPICYHSDVWSLDGRENVILIAEKE